MNKLKIFIYDLLFKNIVKNILKDDCILIQYFGIHNNIHSISDSMNVQKKITKQHDNYFIHKE